MFLWFFGEPQNGSAITAKKKKKNLLESLFLSHLLLSLFAFYFISVDINIQKCVPLKSIMVTDTTTLTCKVSSVRKDELLALWGVNNYFPI